MEIKNSAPLAARCRPQKAEELLGQKAIWAPGTALWKLVHEDRFHSLVFWGPSGTGKTSMARLIASLVNRAVTELSAVEAGVRDMRDVIRRSRENVECGQKSEILFLDEIHRLSKSQQDCLLPSVEAGYIKLIGATSENPSFSVNNALLSRSLVVAFKKLPEQDIAELVVRISTEQGCIISRELAEAIARSADGDGRAALNLLEAVLGCRSGNNVLELSDVKDTLGLIAKHYDKAGEFHYDIISAFIKSIRASDPDAALYYLARMIKGGEDPVFIARRLLIAASEDIGNALPTALVVAQGALASVKEIGMPEARIILAQATTYLASSPKSNRSYLAIDEALAVVERTGDLPIPLHLRNAPTRFMKEQGFGASYIYAHDDPQGAAKMNNLPEQLQDQVFYRPGQQGSEKVIAEFLRILRPERYQST